MSRPARPAPLVALVLATLLLVAVVAQVPTTLGAWIATTDNPGNSFTADTVAPVTGFSAQCQSDDEVVLSWDDPGETAAVTGYRIHRRRDHESEFSLLTTVAGGGTTTYSDQENPFPTSLLNFGTVTVEYRIRATIDGTSWQSTHQQASVSGDVIDVVIGVSFECNA